MTMRPIRAADRSSIERLVKSVGNFNPVEVPIAMELVDDAIEKGDASDYITYVMENEQGGIVGYVCFGKTPLTDTTYDFYWMAVDPEFQGQGLGRQLIAFVESEVKRRDGKLLILETSSLPSYERTIRVYERCGYELNSRIRDFYREGDDRLIYIKYL